MVISTPVIGEPVAEKGGCKTRWSPGWGSCVIRMELSGRIWKAQMNCVDPGLVSPNAKMPESFPSDTYRCHAWTHFTGNNSPDFTSGTSRCVKRILNRLASSVCLPAKTTLVAWHCSSTLRIVNCPLLVIISLACSALKEPTLSREEG